MPTIACPATVRWVSAEPLLGPVNLNRVFCQQRKRAIDSLCGGYWTPTYYVNQSSIPKLDWVVVGGESGPGARPCNVAAVRDIALQCQRAEVPVFVKQLGADPWNVGVHLTLKSRKGADMAEWPEDLRIREFPKLEVLHG